MNLELKRGHSSIETSAGVSSFAARMLARETEKGEARSLVQMMLQAKTPATGWRGMFAVPPGSAIELVLSAFRRETNVPLEIPFFGFLHFVSGMLLANETRITGPIGEISPELWTVVLAPSGSGKTFAVSVIEEASPVKAEFPEAVSGAAFLEGLAEHSPALWLQDEIAQKLKQIEDPKSPLGDAKEYLLRAYDNKRIERVTKKETVRVERPALGILGLNTPESFKKALSQESLLDGFAQRFGFVWAERDPSRPMENFPIYDRPRLLKACEAAFEKVQAVQLHRVYRISHRGAEAFRTSFSLLGKGMEENESYFRRAMFRAFRYAVLYHVILGKAGDTIDDEDVGWGARVSSLHLSDMGKILGEQKELSGVAEKVAKAQEVKKRCEAAGKPFNPRAIQQGVRGVASADEARAIFDLI
ncbi:hypothetical protein ACNHE5_19850 [Pandoraea pnomenusa]|uniref:hypothetical protein n=1 Tax=Pandoraea pnomenusa TaxID=93220 RepID=UPI003CFBA316